MKLLPYNSENGFTLVEVLVALFIIALVIMGGGMFFFYGRVNIVREAHRRAAVLVASQRLEELKGAEWADIAYYPTTAISLDQSYYLTYGSPPSLDEDTDTVTVDNVEGTMLTDAKWRDDNPGDGEDSYDYLEVTVIINWVDSRSNSVSSITLIAP